MNNESASNFLPDRISLINALIRFQKSPLPLRQIAQLDFAYSHPLQPDDLQSHQVAHPANLPLAPFSQHKPQLIAVDPFDMRRFERPAVERQPVPQQSQSVIGQRAPNAHDVFFFDPALFPDDLFRHAPVLREKQQPLRIDIEPPGDGQSFQVFGHQTFIPLAELIRYGEEFDRGSITGLGLSGDVSDRLVQNNCNKFLLFFNGPGGERDFGVWRNFGTESINYNAVNRNQALLD